MSEHAQQHDWVTPPFVRIVSKDTKETSTWWVGEGGGEGGRGEEHGKHIALNTCTKYPRYEAQVQRFVQNYIVV